MPRRFASQQLVQLSLCLAMVLKKIIKDAGVCLAHYVSATYWSIVVGAVSLIIDRDEKRTTTFLDPPLRSGILARASAVMAGRN